MTVLAGLLAVAASVIFVAIGSQIAIATSGHGDEASHSGDDASHGTEGGEDPAH